MRIADATASAAGPDPLRPQRGAGLGRGAAMALLVHGVLLLVLALGVSWRVSEPTGASAELWAAVPEFAAPAPVAPPPQPVQVAPVVPKPAPQPKVEPKPEPSRDAEIAVEKARLQKEKERELEREKERQARAEVEKRKLQVQQEEQRKKLAAAAAAAKVEQADKLEKAELAEQARLDKLRLDNLKRMQGQAGATGGPTATGSAVRDAGPSASYGGRIIARVKPNIVLTETLQGNPRAEVEVRAAADGTIMGRRLVKPSGEKAWDDAVLRAIDRTEILPRDIDGRVPSTLTLIFTP